MHTYIMYMTAQHEDNTVTLRTLVFLKGSASETQQIFIAKLSCGVFLAWHGHSQQVFNPQLIL